MKKRQLSLPAGASRVRAVATMLAVTLTLALAAGAGCESRQDTELPSVRELLEKSHVNGQATLKVGVATREPLMGMRENGVYSGFDIEIARYIAGSLGYTGDQQLEFVPLTTENRIAALQGGQVDLVVASFSMTEERARLVSFAGPYFVTTQEVLVPNRMKDKIRTMEDLRNPAYRICVSGGSTTEAELVQRGIQVQVLTTTTDCLEGIREDRYDAMSSDETILAGFRSQYPKDFQIVDLPFGTSELLGVGVPISDPALRDLVAYFLQKSYLAGRRGESSAWQTAYNRTLGPWLGERQQPPPLDVPELVDFDDKAPQR